MDLNHALPLSPLEARALAEKVAREAGKILREAHSSGVFTTTFKGEGNPVTSADLAVERSLLEGVRAERSTDSFLTEEGFPTLPEHGLAGSWWVVDPIDGTVNFSRGLPHCAISIAYAVDGVVQAGVVYAPILGELFSAARGGGASLNGIPIRVTDCSVLRRALLATGFPYDRDEVDVIAARVARVLSRAQDLRRFGACSLDLAYVACGRLDGYFESVMPWDMAAGGLIVREAGGTMTHFERSAGERSNPRIKGLGEDLDSEVMLACAPRISQQLVDVISGRED